MESTKVATISAKVLYNIDNILSMEEVHGMVLVPCSGGSHFMPIDDEECALCQAQKRLAKSSQYLEILTDCYIGRTSQIAIRCLDPNCVRGEITGFKKQLVPTAHRPTVFLGFLRSLSGTSTQEDHFKYVPDCSNMHWKYDGIFGAAELALRILTVFFNRVIVGPIARQILVPVPPNRSLADTDGMYLPVTFTSPVDFGEDLNQHILGYAGNVKNIATGHRGLAVVFKNTINAEAFPLGVTLVTVNPRKYMCKDNKYDTRAYVFHVIDKLAQTGILSNEISIESVYDLAKTTREKMAHGRAIGDTAGLNKHSAYLRTGH